jgi:uncharacterized membrane protein YobD (UPF0266 family)
MYRISTIQMDPIVKATVFDMFNISNKQVIRYVQKTDHITATKIFTCFMILLSIYNCFVKSTKLIIINKDFF